LPPVIGSTGGPEGVELLEALQESDVDSLGLLSEHIPPSVCDLEMSSARSLQETGTLEVDLRPGHSVVESTLSPTGKELPPLRLRKSKALSQGDPRLFERVFLPVRSEVEHREHERLKVRDRH
jgi:hypothetical protein